jgi:tetratricopeptide (TPR) repeat protein
MHWRIWAIALFTVVLAGLVRAQEAGTAELTRAYKALEAKDYDAAVAAFQQGLLKQPANAGAHKDLAYTLLKTGDNAEARDEFELATKLNPKDEVASLEYAFLAFETKQPIEARRTFDKLRKSSDARIRDTAEQAFQNVDRPLAASIARWQQAIQRSDKPNDITMFSAHWELAQTAELRDDLPLAAKEFEICRQLKPQLSEILITLARIWKQQNRLDEANAALLAASRAGDSRSAELALEQLGTRYPYPYEFVNALKLDPKNTALHRELAFLYVAMHHDGDAMDEFEKVLEINPRDTMAKAQLESMRGAGKTVMAISAPVPAEVVTTGASASDAALQAKDMGMKSFALGYTNDAIKYLTEAHEKDPDDDEVILKLAWALNQSHRDSEAITYFALAKKSSNPKIAAEAAKAYHSLNGDTLPQTTTWALPMYSTRWHDLFSYAQTKRTLPLPSYLTGAKAINSWVSFYLSTRFVGDVKSATQEHSLDPAYLSESSFIFGVGASSKTWHHLTGWVEAGEAITYLPWRKDVGLAIPDYRGGVNFAKGFGELLGSSKSGMFYETTADAIYISRFDKDWLFYSQHRAGRTMQLGDENKLQLLMNLNLTRDSKNEYWANALEFGPGFKIHPAWLPSNLYFSADLLRGVYLDNEYNPRRPNYYDARLSFWYARTK